MAAEKVLGRPEVEAGGDLGARRRGERASAAIPQRKDEVKIRLQNSSQQKHAALAVNNVALRAVSFVVP